jgi:hypothetical protein
VRAYLIACAASLPLPPLLSSLLLPLFPSTVCSWNNLGAEGGTAVAQALHHLPQLQTLSLECALATAESARDGWRGGAAFSSHACVRVWGCDGDGDRDCAGAGDCASDTDSGC